MSNHGAQPPPSARPEIIRHDVGGWISGPSADIPERAEPVPAVEVRRGDVLAYDGRELLVTGANGAWYVEDGAPVAGIAIDTRAGSQRWTLYRRGTDLLHRIRQGGTS